MTAWSHRATGPGAASGLAPGGPGQVQGRVRVPAAGPRPTPSPEDPP
jgi:hypothetical protein